MNFFRAWLNDPLRVASVTPSGSALAALITSEISGHSAPVVELGPGTGVFTDALLARGVAEDQIVLIEYGRNFAAKLAERFPSARIFCMDACRLRHVDLFGEGHAGALVSGLPMLSMSNRKIMAVLEGGFRHLKPGGAFYQFTYGPLCPVPRQILDRLGLETYRIGGTLANVPPASVYRVTRRLTQ